MTAGYSILDSLLGAEIGGYCFLFWNEVHGSPRDAYMTHTGSTIAASPARSITANFGKIGFAHHSGGHRSMPRSGAPSIRVPGGHPSLFRPAPGHECQALEQVRVLFVLDERTG